MINKKPITETVTREEAVSITCDVCKKTFTYGDYKSKPWPEALEIQEFTHIRFAGGYNSVFGDMNKGELDICQHCLKQKLGEFIRINPEEEQE